MVMLRLPYRMSTASGVIKVESPGDGDLMITVVDPAGERGLLFTAEQALVLGHLASEAAKSDRPAWFT